VSRRERRQHTRDKAGSTAAWGHTPRHAHVGWKTRPRTQARVALGPLRR
jgi:hypothetical protein